MKMRIENGWAIIEAAGLIIKVPADPDSMSDDRAEITCNGYRVYVENCGDGPPSVSRFESVADPFGLNPLTTASAGR